MRREAIPTPTENKSSKPYRIYTDPYGDPEGRAHRPVSDAMSPVTTCVGPEVRLSDVRQLLERQHLPGAPVVAPGDQLLGVVLWRDLFASPLASAADVMHRALALPAWTPIGKAAAIMSSEGIDLAAVVDFERRVVGLLAALDIVRWLAREDGYVISAEST